MRKQNEKIIVTLVIGLIVHQCPMMYGQVTEFFTIFDRVNSLHDTYNKFTTPSTADLMDQAMELSEKIDELGNGIEQLKSTMASLLLKLPLATEITVNLAELNKMIGRLDILYGLFEDYLDDPQSFNEPDLKRLIDTFVSIDQTDLSGTLGQIHALIVPKRLTKYKASLFYHLAEQARDNALVLCNTGASPQQRLLELFNIIIGTEMRGALMMRFGIEMEGYLKNVSTEGALKRVDEGWASRSDGYVRILKQSLEIAPTQFRQCDPPKYKRGQNYHEFERFLQTFVVSISALRPRNSCSGRCHRVSQPTRLHLGEDCEGFECSGSPTTCYGRVFGCDSLKWIKICEFDVLQARRYAWYEMADGTYGNSKEGCPAGTMYQADDGFEATYDGDWTCDPCMCTCVEDSPISWASRFISGRRQMTDLKKNMVAVGFQMIIKDKFAHIRVRQAKLGPNGLILERTDSWMEPEDLQFEAGGGERFFKRSKGKPDEEMVRDEDVYPLELDYKRINLDTLVLPEEYLLTGVRFGRNMGQTGRPIQLEIHGTRFDYDTGELDPDDTVWITPEDEDDRDRIDQEQLPSPVNTMQSTEIDPTRETFIDLSMSDRVTDAGQTVLPLLDGVPAMGDPPVPLVGLGLYYKAAPEQGGFLTLVLEEFNRAPYLSSYDKIKGSA